ncbi:hypothetical protein FGB62_361g04 [Gracilaria domingensis]|nr:hypothetical protein FGB62_361g04 [Gracilaria domingensis]
MPSTTASGPEQNPRQQDSKTSYDEILAKAIDNGRNITALSFPCALIQKVVIGEPLATPGDFHLNLKVIFKVAGKQNVPNTPMSAEDFFSLVELARNAVHKPETANTSINVNESHMTIAKNTREHESNDSTTFKDVTAQLLLDWYRIPTGDPDQNIFDQSVISFIAQTCSVSLASGEAAERSFRIAVEIVCSATSQALNSGWGYSNVSPKILDAPYTAADSLLFLVSTLWHTDRSLSLPSSLGAVQVVYYFLVAVAKDAMLRCAKRDLRCHFRLLSCIMNELSAGSASRERSAGENVEANLDRLVSAYSRKLEEVSSGRKGVDFIEDKEGGMLRWVLDLGSVNHHKREVNLNNLQIQGVLVGALSLCSHSQIPRFDWLELLANNEFFPFLLSAINVCFIVPTPFSV